MIKPPRFTSEQQCTRYIQLYLYPYLEKQTQYNNKQSKSTSFVSLKYTVIVWGHKLVRYPVIPVTWSGSGRVRSGSSLGLVGSGLGRVGAGRVGSGLGRVWSGLVWCGRVWVWSGSGLGRVWVGSFWSGRGCLVESHYKLTAPLVMLVKNRENNVMIYYNIETFHNP